MSAPRARRLWPAIFCLCTPLAGCISVNEPPPGTLTNPGPGSYGTSATDSESSWSFVWPWSGKQKVKSSTYLAYAHNEESRANRAATAKNPTEQRAALAAARGAYEHVLASDSKSIDAIVGLARLDQAAGRTKEAEQGFQKALRLNATSGQAHDAYGEFLAAQKRWPEATQELQKAMTAEPEEKSYQFHYGIAVAKSGQVEAARPHLVESVGLAAAHYNLGVTLYEQGDRGRAEEEFVAAILENPRLEQAQKWLAELHRDERQTPARLAKGPGGASRSAVIPASASAPATDDGRPPVVRGDFTARQVSADEIVASAIPSVSAPPPAAISRQAPTAATEESAESSAWRDFPVAK